MFGLFRTALASNNGKVFNRDFWLVDVPLAAEAYPALWHACLAFTAIHESVKLEQANNLTVNDVGKGLMANEYYTFALRHFNKSIRYVVNTIHASKNLRYEDQEMVIMTNIIYIGISNMLEEPKQAVTHTKNLLDLVQQFRFGEDQNFSSTQRLRHTGLLGLILFIDGHADNHAEIVSRYSRSYAVKVPRYERFTSVSEAYVELLSIHLEELQEVKLFDLPVPAKKTRRKQLGDAFVSKLDAFEKTCDPGNLDPYSIATMRLFAEYKSITIRMISSKSWQQRIRNEEVFLPFLDKIDAVLEKEASMSSYTRDGTQPMPVSYSLSLNTMLLFILSAARLTTLRQKATRLINKWPCRENGWNSSLWIAFFDTKTIFEAENPQRTLPMQRQGHVARPSYPTSACSIIFDPYEGCDCIPPDFVCADHRLYQHSLTMDNGRCMVTFKSKYDLHYGFEGASYEFAWA